MSDLWSHQREAVSRVFDSISSGNRRICLAMVTGGGKTRVARELIEHYLRLGLKVSFYSNRKLLVEQTSSVMEKAGVGHGVRMSGEQEQLDERFQISSVQTEAARVLRRKSRAIHDASLVVIDEAHLNSSDTAKELIDLHMRREDCILVGLTATPLDLAHFYDHLVVAGVTSEGRSCGALVAAHHYGPDEPDLRYIGRVSLGDDLTEGQVRKAMGGIFEGKPDQKLMRLFGRVMDEWEKPHTKGKPTILFAPGVAESLWFAEQFKARGIAAAHIDGEDVWIDGELVKTSRNAREEVRQASKHGRIQVVCCRFVLREGADWPWLEVGIFATVFGSLQSYIQSGGRLLRATAGKPHATILDFGGNWHRNGSLNADRNWELGDTAHVVSGLREERLRSKEEREPFLCPRCTRVLSTLTCPGCGFTVDLKKKSRPVIQSDGALKEYTGDIYKPRVTKCEPDTAKKWERVYWGQRKAGKTFREARGWFYQLHGYFPDEGIKLMPKQTEDWFRKVADVDRSELI